MRQKKLTPKKKYDSSSPLLTKPDQEGLRLLDIVGGTLIAQTIEEHAEGVILEYPGLYTETLQHVNGGESFCRVARIDPFGNVRDNYRYKLYYAAVRGEVYTYDPRIKELYAAFVAWMKAGKLADPKPEMVLTDENADGASAK